VVTPKLEDSLGYIVEVRAGPNDDDDGGYYIGHVIGCNASSSTVRVSFHTEEPGSKYIDDVLYSSIVSWKLPDPEVLRILRYYGCHVPYTVFLKLFIYSRICLFLTIVLLLNIF
jgi:hypothetical protein